VTISDSGSVSRSADEHLDEEEDGNHDMGHNGQDSMLSREDLALDEDEFPFGSDLDTFIEMTWEIANELAYLEVCFACSMSLIITQSLLQ